MSLSSTNYRYKKMIALDCKNEVSAYDSVGTILGLSRSTLQQWLTCFDLSQYCEKNPLDDPDYIVLHELQDQLGLTPDLNTANTFYFHLTRTIDPFSFREGLKPLSKAALDHIWSFLYEFVEIANPNFSRKNWDNFRDSLERNDPLLPPKLQGFHFRYLYNLKRNDKHLTGPFGMLIRETAFSADRLGNHDYLRIPEIVEDICLCYKEMYQIDLTFYFEQQAKPCIVKFRVDDCSSRAIATALNYLYQKAHSQILSRISIHDFDARGMLILSDQIACIECPPDNVLWGTF